MVFARILLLDSSFVYYTSTLLRSASLTPNANITLQLAAAIALISTPLYLNLRSARASVIQQLIQFVSMAVLMSSDLWGNWTELCIALGAVSGATLVIYLFGLLESPATSAETEDYVDAVEGPPAGALSEPPNRPDLPGNPDQAELPKQPQLPKVRSLPALPHRPRLSDQPQLPDLPVLPQFPRPVHTPLPRLPDLPDLPDPWDHPKYRKNNSSSRKGHR